MGPRLRRRKSNISTVYLLFLLLSFLKNLGINYNLCEILGILSTFRSVCVECAIEVFYEVCKNRLCPSLEVRGPTVGDMKECLGLLKRNRPNRELIENVFGVVGGSRLPCADYVQADIHNAGYEEYTQAV